MQSFIERFDLNVGYTDYRHAEIEGGMEGTVFTNKTTEIRARLKTHWPIGMV